MKTQKQRHFLDAFNVKHDFVIETKAFSNVNLFNPIPSEPDEPEDEPEVE